MADIKHTSVITNVGAHIDFDDGTRAAFVGFKEVVTTWHRAGDEWIEGLKEVTVKPSPQLTDPSLIGKVGTLSLDDGDSFPSFTPDGTRFVRSA